MADTIRVQVIYADPQRQIARDIEVAAGASVDDAIRSSAILDELPGFVPRAVGVFGRIANGSDTLRDGDRIELYRPLKIDPKEARRRRAAK